MDVVAPVAATPRAATAPPAAPSVPAPSAEKPPQPYSSHIAAYTIHNVMHEVSVDLNVEEVPKHGLRFFALQVNFGDGSGAHGGPQRDPSDGMANWGGLSSWAYDYKGHEIDALRQIQNLPGRTREANWQDNTWYTLTVKRGPREVLPAGDYSVLDEPPTHVPFDREMTRWDFTITPRGGGEPVWEQSLFAASDRISQMLYWTETGYGIDCDDKLSVRWENPRYRTPDGEEFQPLMLRKSLRQSTCPEGPNSDMHAYDPDSLGVHQVYGEPRSPASHHGQVLHIANPRRDAAEGARLVSEQSSRQMLRV